MFILILCLQLHYTFSKLRMMNEPLLAVAAFYLLFLTVIIYVRLDFSITKVSSVHPQQYHNIRSLCLVLITLCEETYRILTAFYSS